MEKFAQLLKISDQLKVEFLKSIKFKKRLGINESVNFDLVMGRFSVILDVIKEKRLEKQVDIWRIVQGTIDQSRWPDLVFNSPEKYLIELTKNLKQGIIWPDIRFPVIPPKQREFSIKEASVLTRRTERTIRSDLDTGKLHGEKAGRRWIISRKSLLGYLRGLKKR